MTPEGQETGREESLLQETRWSRHRGFQYETITVTGVGKGTESMFIR